MLKAPVELSVRVAGWVGTRVKEPGNSRLALLAYRAAGLLVGARGGRLQSRIISFTASYSDNCCHLEQTISELAEHLKGLNITVDVRETILSAAEAMTNPDTRDWCRDVEESTHFYELFVPTHEYWKAATSRFMSKLAESTTPEA